MRDGSGVLATLKCLEAEVRALQSQITELRGEKAKILARAEASEAYIAQVREPVRLFARAMEVKLRQHDHKDGWCDLSLEETLERVTEELQELTTVAWAWDEAAYRSDEANAHAAQMLGEAADVANFLMFLVDNTGVLDLSNVELVGCAPAS